MFNAVEYINTPRWQNVSLGLDRTRLLLELLGNPQYSLKFVHVAGTNGKGSTCAFLESIFRTSGLKTGLFTSPYLMCFEDRIRVNNTNISKQALTEITLQVKDAAERVERELGEHPTEFEIMTAISFSHFAREKCDIVVCEVGLGGRLDSTNVINPLVSVITHIGLDHQAILGETVEEIAFEKAGIVKPEVPVVLGPQDDEGVYSIVEGVAKNLNAPLVALRKTAVKPSSELPSLFSLSQSEMESSDRSAFSENNTRFALPKFVFEHTPAAGEHANRSLFSLSQSEMENSDRSAFSANNTRFALPKFAFEHTPAAGEHANPSLFSLSQSEMENSDRSAFSANNTRFALPKFAFEHTPAAGELASSLFSLSEIKMKGEYQEENAVIAAEVARLMGVADEAIKVGLKNATWPGRFEIFGGDGPSVKVIVDGAHNVDGAHALRESLVALGEQNRVAVFGALRDKDVAGIVEEVGDLFSHFFVYEVNSPRAMSIPELALLTSRFAETEVADSAVAAVVKALDFAKKEGHQNLVVCFGSLYSIGDIRRHLLKIAGN